MIVNVFLYNLTKNMNESIHLTGNYLKHKKKTSLYLKDMCQK